MNNRILSPITILAGLMATASALDSLTVGDVTYENVQLKKEYPTSLFIQHSGGTAFVEKSKLSEDQVASILGGETPSTSGANTSAPDGPLFSGDWIYKPNEFEDGEVAIIGHKNPSGDVVFPEEIDGRPVSRLDRPMFKENGANITSIKIPDSVTSVMCATFTDLPALTNVSIGKGFASRGASLFSGCGALEKFEVSEENPTFSTKDGVLFNKDQTRLVRYPDGKEGNYTIPNGVEVIENEAFGGGKLTGIVIPEGVTEIEGAAFIGGFGALKSLTIASGTTKLGDKAFVGIYDNLERLSVPSALQDEAERERVGLNFENFADLVSASP